MVTKVTHPVLPGGLSDDDRARILDLVARKHGYARIARAISKHPSTVATFLYREGLKRRGRGKLPGPYMRAGKLVRPFPPEEDAFITARRLAGQSTYAIAEEVEARFGYARGAHAVEVRLKMLAGFEEAAAERQAA